MLPSFQKRIGKRGAIACLVVLQFVALEIATILTLPNLYKWHGDVQHYYNYSLRLMEGQLPYRDFPLEYPPLALLPFILPQLVNFGKPLSFFGYVFLFLFQNGLICTAIALLLDYIVSRPQQWLGELYTALRTSDSRIISSQSSSVQVLSVYVLLVAIASPLLPWRYDLFPAILTLFALLSVMMGRSTIAGIWLGFSIAAKLYPIVLIPIFSAYYLALRKYRALLNFLLGSVGATCLTLLPFLLTAPLELLSFLRYHQERGLQIESLPAGIISLAHILGLTQAETVVNYGAFHLVSPLTGYVLKWLPWVFIVTFGAAIALCARRFRYERAIAGTISIDSLVAYIIVALLIFMATNKVFSPQYIIWLLPFAPLLRLRQSGILIAIYAISIIISPFSYRGLRTMQTIPVLLLNLRNILVVVLILWLIIERLGAGGDRGLSPKRWGAIALRRTRWFSKG